ncbi:MAG TPA: ABC transporter permease [Thermoanaerobaculaceae bacterium]|nr:ABC transporter permease [Thermoanaerobaculaceae bacterium]HPS78113.1 ABC transporter permease [Thermoanaerobaculaceae bacterium]
MSAAAHPGVIATARREAGRLAGQPIYLLLMLVFPLASFGLLWAIFSSEVPSELPIAVVDLDHSTLSRQLVRMTDATRTMRVAFEPSDEPAAQRLIREGTAYAVVVIPRDLEREVRRGETAGVVCQYNAQLLLPASLIRRDLRAVVGTLSAGVELRRRQAGGAPRAVAMAQMEPVRVERHTLFNPQLSYVTYLLAALLPTMLQVFILVTAVQAVGSELKDSTAGEWLEVAGGRAWKAVLGKLLPHTVAFVVLSLAMLAVLFRALDLPMRGSLGVLAGGTILFVLAVQGMGLALCAWLANLRFATSAAGLLASPAFAFSGVTFPVSAMPAVAQAWGALIPLTHYLRLLVDQAVRGATPAASAVPLAALAAFAVVLPAASLLRLGRVARDARFWGQP